MVSIGKCDLTQKGACPGKCFLLFCFLTFFQGQQGRTWMSLILNRAATESGLAALSTKVMELASFIPLVGMVFLLILAWQTLTHFIRSKSNWLPSLAGPLPLCPIPHPEQADRLLHLFSSGILYS